MSEDPILEAEWLSNPETQAILAALDGAARRTRIVGGVIRDTIMDVPRVSTDIDMATELLPQEVMARAGDAGIASYPTGIEHGTVTLKLGETIAEVTTLRRDVETDGRHAVVAFGTDWVEDASRRDFTLNALYCDADGTLFDPLDGVGDAVLGVVRFIGEARQRIDEDGLRVYRFFRFSASHAGEAFDAPSLAACADAVDRLGHLSRERVGAEMLRMLTLPKVAKTLTTMADIGLLAANDDAMLALGLYEALGGRSVAARLVLLTGGQLEPLQDRWRLSNAVVKETASIAAAADILAGERIGEAAYRHGELAIEGLAVAAVRGQWSKARLAEAARMLAANIVPDFPVSGHDLAGLGLMPGPALGQELARLERAWIESGFALGKGELLALVKR